VFNPLVHLFQACIIVLLWWFFLGDPAWLISLNVLISASNWVLVSFCIFPLSCVMFCLI
jgi:hypothetical protein